MSINAVKLSELSGEFVDGPAHTRSEVEVALERIGEEIVLTQTAKHRAAPDRSIRGELTTEDARKLHGELERLLEE